MKALGSTTRAACAGRAKPVLSREVAGILNRLGTSAEYWQQRMKKLFGKPRLLGSHFATSAERLQDIAARHGVHHVDNEVSVALSGLFVRRDTET